MEISIDGVMICIGATVKVVPVGISKGSDVGNVVWMGGCVVTRTGSGVNNCTGTAVIAIVGAGT